MTQKPAVSDEDLDERLRFETMLAELSSRFVNLEPAEVDHEIEDAQRGVCECLGLDLAEFWQLSPAVPGVLRMPHLYRPLGGAPVPDDFDAREYNRWALERALGGRVVSLPSFDEAPAEASQQVEQQNQQAQQATAEQIENFKKAFSVCLEAKKYMVKY